MHPDLPPSGDSGPDPIEQLLRSLPVAALPPDLRASILSSAAAPLATPFLTKSFCTLMLSIWSLAAVFHLTTPAPSPVPDHPGFPADFHQSMPPDFEFSDPWLAQVQISSHPLKP